jgi:hypothetical protein
MPLREGRYKSIVDLMKRRVDPSFRTLAVTGRELAHCFKQLHAQGLCYRDISFANVFFEPKTGEVLVCDNDNVGPPDAAVVGVLGTPGFMAPEIVRREAKPNTETDLHSLAVLLFYLLVVAHPLDGAREASVKCLDLPARERLYGTHPLFIFDPADDSNRPVTGLHNNALLTWPMLPRFLQAMFTRAFTVGLHQPHSGRVREGEWRQGMVALGDCVYYCPCGCEQFHDDAQATEGAICWHCQQRVRRPPRLRFERGAVVMLNHDTTLWPHHVGGPERQFDFGQPVAAMVQHPSKPGVWGLRNDSDQVWTRTSPDGETVEVPAGRSATLAAGTRIRFGPSEAEVVV